MSDYDRGFEEGCEMGRRGVRMEMRDRNIAKAETERDSFHRMLVGIRDGYPRGVSRYCPVCGVRQRGHLDDCELVQLLRPVTSPEQSAGTVADRLRTDQEQENGENT